MSSDDVTGPLPPNYQDRRSDRLIGELVSGRYRVLTSIGEGGFGVVYEADQTHPVRRRVALKVLKRGMDSKSILGRFEAERQALALMNHPGIAKILDAGETKDDLPYFVMELVRGVPITDYCDRHRLSIEARLELFARVCDAIQHAHTKSIIHRDIKPSNVLVEVHESGTPIPKVIDFGIAKALSSPLTEKTVFTERGQVIGTPQYMSPEQANLTGEDIDARTDIYSLGVLLYELVTGKGPFDLHAAALMEMLRVICEVDPPRPSTRLSSLGGSASQIAQARQTDPRTLTGRLRRELEWIPLKAIRKDRTERYKTAAALGDDIRRYLSGDPLHARPETHGYRLRKFCRRNRTLVAFVLAVISVLAAATTVSGWQWRRTAAARSAEARERLIAQASVDFLLNDMLGSIDPETADAGASVPISAVIDAAADGIGGRFATVPQAERTLREAFGRSYLLLGRPDQAVAQLELARAIAEQDTGPHARDARPIDMALAEALWRSGRAQEALAIYDRIGQSIDATTDEDFLFDLTLQLGNALKEVGRIDGRIEPAREQYRRAMSIGGPSPSNERRRLLVEHNLVLVDLIEAAQPKNAERRPAAIEDALRRMQSIYQRSASALGPDSPFALNTRNEVASQLLRLRRLDAAAEIYHDLIPRMRSVFGERHWRVLEARSNHARLLEWRGDLPAAQRIMEEVVVGYRDTRGPAHEATVRVTVRLADLHARLGNPQAAERLLDDARALLPPSGTDPPAGAPADPGDPPKPATP